MRTTLARLWKEGTARDKRTEIGKEGRTLFKSPSYAVGGKRQAKKVKEV